MHLSRSPMQQVFISKDPREVNPAQRYKLLSVPAPYSIGQSVTKLLIAYWVLRIADMPCNIHSYSRGFACMSQKAEPDCTNEYSLRGVI